MKNKIKYLTKHKFKVKKSKINRRTKKKHTKRGGVKRNRDETDDQCKLKQPKMYSTVENINYTYTTIVGENNQENNGLYTGPWYNGIEPYSIGEGKFKSTGTFNGIKKMINSEITTWEYNGNWLNGKPDTLCSHKDATLTFNDENIIYTGKFKEGNLEGKGKLIDTQNNFEYKGDFENSKIQGIGELTTPDFSYKGDFKNNKKNGYGIYENATRTVKYEGEFKDDIMEGNGKLDNNVMTYDGIFKNNKINGLGNLQIKHTGVKMNGKFTPDGSSFIFNGTVTYPDGSTYTGKLINFQRVNNEPGVIVGDNTKLVNESKYDIRFGMMSDPTSITFNMDYFDMNFFR